jgi:tetratricopeptide (TPR) repeat protein
MSDQSFSDWPYANAYRLDSGAIEEINAEAKAVLARSLVSGRIIAFIGSGVSDCYGRMSWIEMVDRMRARALELSPHTKRGQQLKDVLNKRKIDRTSKPEADLLPIIAEMAIRLFDECHQSGPPKDQKDSPARRLVKRDIVDDLGHARSLLFDALVSSAYLDPQFKKEARTGIHGFEFVPKKDERLHEEIERILRTKIDELDKDRLRSIFSYQTLELLLEKLIHSPNGLIQAFITPTKLLLTRNPVTLGADDSSQTLPIRYRYLVTLGFAVTGAKFSDLDTKYCRKVRPPRRQDLVERDRDPLLLMYENLGLRRFVTTNYDREIERLFSDKGLSLSDDGRKHAGDEDWASRIVGHDDARVIVYEQKKAGSLIAFSSQDKTSGSGVVYLHGRATDGDDIVIGEKDYRELYLKQTPFKALSQSALGLTFGANPIVFFGLGLNEDDLLRPLRDFMSGTESFMQRPIIAVMPRSDTVASAETQSSKFLARYGVLTIYYGNCELPGDAAETLKLSSWFDSTISLLKSCAQLVEKAPRRPGALSVTGGIAGDDFVKLKEGLDQTFCKISLDRREIVGPCSIEDQAASKSSPLNLDIELRTLEGIYSATKGLSASSDLELQPALSAAIAALRSSIQGSFFCAWLMRMQRDRDEWNRRWLEFPRRSSFDEHSFQTRRAFGVVKLEPRPEEGVSAPLQVPSQRFYAAAASQTFNNLLASLDSHPEVQDDITGRRIFIFVGERGVGRGHFVAALNSDERIDQLRERLNNNEAWFLVGLYSVSHTTDFGEILEEIRTLLRGYLERLVDCRRGDAHQIGELARFAENREVGRLEAIVYILRRLSILANDSTERLPRILLVLNSFHVLFDAEGREKNATIGQFIAGLISDETAKAPIDLIFVCKSNGLPRHFRRTLDEDLEACRKSALSAIELRPPNLSAARRLQLDHIVDALGINIDRSTTPARQSPSGQTAKPRFRERNYLHMLRDARASIVLTSFYPRLAVMLAVGIALKECKGASIIAPLKTRSDEQAEEWNRLIIEFRNAVVGDVIGTPPMKRAEYLGAVREAGERVLDLVAEIVLLGHQSKDGNVIGPIVRLLTTSEGATQAAAEAIKTSLDKTLRSLATNISVRRRYSMTLLAATAFDMASDYFYGDQKGDRVANFGNACALVTEFLQRPDFSLGSHEPRERDAAIVELCLRVFRARHERYLALPVSIPDWSRGWKSTDQLRGPRMFDLQHTILWHLAAFGQPVPRTALRRCPKVIEAARHVSADERAQQPGLVDHLIEFALELLVERCLAMPMRANPASADQREGDGRSEVSEQGGRAPHYTVHRTVQLHLLRLLGSPAVEYQEVNQFTVTSYMTQPRDMPRLKREAHQELRRAISALIRFPDPDGEREEIDTSSSGPNGGDIEAALAMMRSVYTVASIARLGSGEGEPFWATSDVGFFGDHARQVRWLLYMNAVRGNQSNERRSLLSADQIVWALNECGVMHLTRGQLGEARVLLDLADREAGAIERYETDPTRTRIFLNRALVMIESGRGRDVLRRLISISGNGGEHPALRAIANGFQGLVHHIEGRHDDAIACYNSSVRTLVGLNRARPASIFSRNWGNLLRTIENYPEAQLKLNEAINLADEGSHQDVLQEALVARCGLWIRDGKRRESAVAVHAHLNAAERYAQTMGISKLLCDVHRLRGLLRQRSGDYSQASHDFAESLRVAVANRQKLRVVSALVHLAEVQIQTGAFSSCGPVLEMATAMAKSAGHHSGLSHAARLRVRLENV